MRVVHETPNRLLAALLSAEPRLRRRLESIQLDPGEMLGERGEAIPYAYFPETAVISLLTVMRDGRVVESAAVGREGFVHIAVALSGVPYNAKRTVVQVPGRARRIRSRVLRATLARHPNVHALVLRYAEALLFQVMQSGACNQLHTVEARCVRWLLMTHDRVGGDSFQLTQRYLATMLAVRRASVGSVAGSLQRKGFINYSRGLITIRDRSGLESAACECYRRIRREYERQPRGSAPTGHRSVGGDR
jgi:CRP-like cAMP-binding protein